MLAAILWMSPGFAADLPHTPMQGDAKIAFKPADDTGGSIGRVFGGFILVVLLGYGAVFAIKRYFPSAIGYAASGQRRIDVLEARRLTPRATLFLVQIEGARLLIGHTGDQLVKLHEFRGEQSGDMSLEEVEK